MKAIQALKNAIRWRLGHRVPAVELQTGTDAAISEFYQSRITDCRFLGDPSHYEHPRAAWILEQIPEGDLLEIGAGNGGMTRLMAPKVRSVVALDISEMSLRDVRDLALDNVKTEVALVERYCPTQQFDSIVMSEVLEHLRNPQMVVRNCVSWLTPGGSLLVTTPNGHWESNEHLHEWTLESFTRILANSGAEQIQVGYLRDSAGLRRWLVGAAIAPQLAVINDSFTDRRAIARNRRQS